MKGAGKGVPSGPPPPNGRHAERRSSYAEKVAAKVPVTSLDLDGIAEYIKSGACKSVLALTGAGISTCAGIPDFRSAGGFYDTLDVNALTCTQEQRACIQADPQAAMGRGLFLENPLPFLELERAFALGVLERKWKATAVHWFFKFLADDGLLAKHFTSNVDGLDYQTGICPKNVYGVHGTMTRARCEERRCRAEMDFEWFCGQLRQRVKDITGRDASAPEFSSPVPCPQCGRPTMKPDVVLFEGDMPADYDETVSQVLPSAGPCKVDLFIVAGTSLKVPPINSLVKQFGFARPSHPRLIVDKLPVGENLGLLYGEGSVRDIFCEGSCDEVFLRLMLKLGWVERLQSIRENLPTSSRALLDEMLSSSYLTQDTRISPAGS